MPKFSVLIIEDEKNIQTFMGKVLKRHDYQVLYADTGKQGLEMIRSRCPDLILLDLGLPDMDGCSIIRDVRTWASTPIIVISARTAEREKVAALDLGADDYITKPFDPEEVIARVEAAMRRYTKEAQNMEAEQEVFRYKNLSLYPQSRKVEVSGIELPLTMHEYDILYLLIQNPQKVYSREHLYEQVWKGGYYGEDNTVNVHVSNLRKKIQKADKEESYIKTVWGIGFKLE